MQYLLVFIKSFYKQYIYEIDLLNNKLVFLDFFHQMIGGYKEIKLNRFKKQ